MPQCPHCQNEYEAGQRYCSTCGSFLLHPDQGDTFCPQCGGRVSPLQEFCHECDAPLKGGKGPHEPVGALPEAEPPAPEPTPVKVPPPGMPSWLIGLLVGSGIVIIILLILLFSRGTSPPSAPLSASKAEAPGPAPVTPAPAPAAPVTPAPSASPAEPASGATDLKAQLQGALSTLREAQLNKDILQFMSVYSLTYPGLDDKRTKTLKAWENFDFTTLVFTIDKVQPIDANNAIAWVTWYVDTRNRRSQELSSASQTYQVRFAKEMDRWRIRSLEEVDQ